MLEFDFNSRLTKVSSFIESNNLDFLFITNLQNIFWLSGTGQYGVMLIPKEGEPLLFVRRNIVRARDESVLKNVIELKKTSQIIETAQENNYNFENSRIGMELDTLPSSYYLNYARIFKHAEIINVEKDLRLLRAIKDEKEREILREGGKIAQKIQETIQAFASPGMKEYEIAAEVMHESIRNKTMHFCKVNAYLDNWFIVASGENLWNASTFPVLSGNGHSNAIPYGYSDRELKSGDILMCDYGIIYKGYHIDHARTYYIDVLPAKFKERYLILKEAYEEVVNNYLRPKTPVKEIFIQLKERLAKEKLGNYFQGNGYYSQGLGHGIGLELDEPPFVTNTNEELLEKNMVISLEPKIMIPGWGAIDLEDNFIITDGKAERITKTPYLFE